MGRGKTSAYGEGRGHGEGGHGEGGHGVCEGCGWRL